MHRRLRPAQFLPPTREVRAVVEGLQQFLPGTHTPNPASQVPGTPTAVTAANGIFYGQYHAPIGEYIFPENVPGQPIPENNFNTIDFLAYGGYTVLHRRPGRRAQPMAQQRRPAGARLRHPDDQRRTVLGRQRRQHLTSRVA